MSLVERGLVLYAIYYNKENHEILNTIKEDSLITDDWKRQLEPIIHRKDIHELAQRISNNINQEKSSSWTDLYVMLTHILNIMTDKGENISWSKIVVFFAFVALVAQQCDQIVCDHLVDILLYYTTTLFTPWIDKNGGWDSFIRQKSFAYKVRDWILSIFVRK